MKKVAALAGLGASVFVGRRYLAMRDAIADVDPELRSPLLPLLPGSTNARTLPLVRKVFRLSLKPGEGVTVTERRIAGDPAVRVLVTTPAEHDAPRPAVLWIHSGGMILGSPQFEAPFSGRLARELGAVVVSPDYRLAPEHPFPAALDDCMAVLRWMLASADELGIDPQRIAVAGGSAGGGLSAAVAQRSHDERIPLRAQVLIYPILDDRTALCEDHDRRGRFMWTPAASKFAWTAYLGRQPRMSDAPEYAAPARRTDLAGLPPAWIGAGDLDLLHEESVRYAEQLKACGVPCELVTVPKMYHGADLIASKAASMQEFSRSYVGYLRTYL
ncbi:alpha/beta hydrolase [Mycobacterium sp. 1165178.9]|uniref:alpha/beta hydrolase n=1 Tax=Mycobacterium sp. 1165178.9 TaxID=1834070 RepID=UPI0007FFF5E6|nr:alpha/beta hydrolase [Mycobacterium sp. 1165178.9]OBK64126.1 alpha/beta hydrolase [Mycobacterium sp. 1165178.9]